VCEAKNTGSLVGPKCQFGEISEQGNRTNFIQYYRARLNEPAVYCYSTYFISLESSKTEIINLMTHFEISC